MVVPLVVVMWSASHMTWRARGAWCCGSDEDDADADARAAGPLSTLVASYFSQAVDAVEKATGGCGGDAALARVAAMHIGIAATISRVFASCLRIARPVSWLRWRMTCLYHVCCTRVCAGCTVRWGDSCRSAAAFSGSAACAVHKC